MKNYLGFDLQLHAEADEFEELEDEGYQGDDDEVDLEEDVDVDVKEDEIDDEEFEDDDQDDDQDDDSDDDSGEDGDDDSKLDKKTKAIIRYKKEKKEAEEKLAKLEAEMQAKEEQAEKKKLIDEKIEAGFPEKQAERIAEIELENRRLKKVATDAKFDKLENKYPLISNHRDEILEMQKKFDGATIEEVYLAKFYKGTTKEAEEIAKERMLRQQKEAGSKTGSKGAGSDSMSKSKVRLSPSDKRAYELVKRSHPDMTKKRFLALMEEDEIIEE